MNVKKAQVIPSILIFSNEKKLHQRDFQKEGKIGEAQRNISLITVYISTPVSLKRQKVKHLTSAVFLLTNPISSLKNIGQSLLTKKLL
ncbi:hypothetical protein ES703_70530 [subsurface metagenome]